MVAFFYQGLSLVSTIRSERGIGVAFMAALTEAFRLRLCLKRTDIVSRAASGVAALRLVAR